MKKYEKTNAITLIALVITIVILLILAGVTIIALTGENGLINKIAIARKEQLESEAEEKLKLKIMELQTNIVDKEGRQAVLEDLNCWTNVESDYYDSEITSVTDSQENTNKLVEIDGYIFEVDENLNVVGVIEVDITSKTETTYQINSIDGDVMQVTIKIKNASGVEKVVTPEGKEIIPQTNKTEIAIDYEVTSGNNYTFKVKVSGSDEIKEYVLKADINAKPEIDQNESYAYPILTEYGVEINKTVEIDYGENTNNYYSIDNGETWNKYTETVKIQSECTLMAKTVIEGEITRETKKEITLELAVDALGSDSYDGDIETGWTYTYGSSAVGKVRIDESMQGKKMYIKLYCNSAGYNGGIKFYDDNNESISTAGVKSGDFESVVDIPENAIYFQCFKENGGGQVTVYEISVADDPIIKYTEINPTITESGIDKVHWDVTIEYHNTSIKKEYKIDDGNWCEYNGDIIRLEIGQTIYARGYNNKGNVTRITSNITAEIKGDSMGLDAYDGDIETGWTYTYGSSVVGKVKIDESMQGKKMYVKLYCNSYGYNGGIKFYDNNNESISTAGVMSGDFESVVDIPENATYFQCFKENGGGQVTVYEISVADDPIIKYTEINPTITESGIDKVHWDVTIEYHNTSIKKEYKIDDGNWCEYNGDIIRLEIGQTIYARGYNDKGNVTRITSNITAEIKGDSMGLDAYDGDIETGWTYTYGSSVVGKVKIDESMQGKKMYVKLYCNSYGYNGGIKFYDNNNESISTAGVMSGDFESAVDIPENAVYFQCFKENGGGQVTVYEISTVNE